MRTSNDISDIKPHMSSVNEGVTFSPNLNLEESLRFVYSDSPRSPQQKYEAYVVTSGRKVGIFMSWLDAKQATEGIPEARYKGYTLKAAVNKWNEDIQRDSQLYSVAMKQLALESRSPKAAVPQTPSTPHRRQQPFSPPSTPSHLRSPPFPSTPPHHTNTTTFYVVQRGERPGVYIGRTASWNAAGPDPRAYYFSTASKEAAWETFGRLVMAEEVEYL